FVAKLERTKSLAGRHQVCAVELPSAERFAQEPFFAFEQRNVPDEVRRKSVPAVKLRIAAFSAVGVERALRANRVIEREDLAGVVERFREGVGQTYVELVEQPALKTRLQCVIYRLRRIIPESHKALGEDAAVARRSFIKSCSGRVVDASALARHLERGAGRHKVREPWERYRAQTQH